MLRECKSKLDDGYFDKKLRKLHLEYEIRMTRA